MNSANGKVFDVLIIGGGIMGSSSAFHLTKADSSLKVAVIERDPTYSQASTSLSMANARVQFSLKENIQISLHALDVLERFENDMTVNGNSPSIEYRREGNLFLVNEEMQESAKDALALQQQLGGEVEWWTPDRIRERFPLYETHGLAGGTFGPKDGHFDAYGVLMGYRAKAKAQGAQYLHDEVTEVLVHDRRVTGVKLHSGEVLSSGAVINCSGPWAREVAATAGVDLPVYPVKRQVFALDTAVKPASALPLTILPSGLYFRTETGGLILLGKSLEEDPVGYNFSWDDKRFMEMLWPELAEFVPAFDTLKLIRGWAGLYAENTLDGNAILGEWPEIRGFFLANGFSGHGLQQGPAVGRYLAELITGVRPSLDLSIFHPQRIMEKKPLSENGLV